MTISEGRARLRTASGYRDFEAGETGLVPAGTVHRFEALDREGWAFCSRFVSGPNVVWKGGRSAIIERVTQELSTRPTLQTDVVSVANACAVSPGHLSRIFRNQVGTSLHNFHVVLALHKAKKLLQQRESLVEAALDGGFFDQAHFTREFVRMIGLTPGSFRNAWAAAV
ncbi:AraC-like DNA-binding protein [Phyllobacterium endophyticum]|nr:AraC-like DNA-binding protein [Phyllobacterium endophyticum]